MDAVISRIADGMEQHRYRFRTVSITHLHDAQNAVGDLVRQGMVSETLSRGWRFYLEANEKLPGAKTIVVIAMPQYITRVTFRKQGKVLAANIPPGYLIRADESRAEQILKNVLENNGNKIVRARLALKTLAVRSGLAKYGRDNISYVPGMGSFLRLIAFYADYPHAEDNWQEADMMKACENCALCREICPTGCIPSDRFLIHAEKCLTYFNEEETDFPHWLKPEAHNTLIGCMKCQSVCPVNKPYLDRIEDGPDFSEEETELILNKAQVEKLSPETRLKLDRMVEDGIYPVAGRNLGMLIEQEGKSSGK